MTAALNLTDLLDRATAPAQALFDVMQSTLDPLKPPQCILALLIAKRRSYRCHARIEGIGIAVDQRHVEAIGRVWRLVPVLNWRLRGDKDFGATRVYAIVGRK